ncbi:peptidoglycan-binding protein LysM [Paraburkholderia sp. J12]|uniref:peptidoglycan-binding protein LysM n=1 Tax=Paraburkholderia sp. J12 TaxID=2805432 RepID=UPI002ABDBCC8|nr:peptidoglycan-binding protein LysM [Paraburkholderia sp. J12]
MGIINFIKEAGEKLFGAATPAAAASAAQPEAAPAADLATLNQKAGDAIAAYIHSQGLSADNLGVTYDGVTHAVTVTGNAADQATKEKILVAAGNVQNVDKVDDQMTVTNPAPEAQHHTVVAGDNLWKIAEQYYGSGAKNDVIFQANTPMLKSPDKIYPGQVLVIPPLQ